jgi:hypothetical protein
MGQGLQMMKTISTKQDLDEARTKERAIVFLWVDWAIQARQSEIAVYKLLKSLDGDYPDSSLPAYRADLSKQEGEVWITVREWLKTARQLEGQLTFGGSGALLCLHSGSITLVIPYAAEVEQNELLALTRGALR